MVIPLLDGVVQRRLVVQIREAMKRLAYLLDAASEQTPSKYLSQPKDSLQKENLDATVPSPHTPTQGA